LHHRDLYFRPAVPTISSKRRILFWLTVILIPCCALLFVPYKSTTAPPWRIQVVDEKNNSISGLMVQEEWRYVGLDIAGWIDRRYTDAEGWVWFPRRTIWASRVSRIIGISGNERGGPGVFILACDETHLKEARIYWDGNAFWGVSGKETKTRIRAKSVKDCTMM
jgi:hypothetical protein